MLLAITTALSATDTEMAVSAEWSPSPPTSFPDAEEDVSGCILLFGAYANGNMGDVIQSSTMARLISNVAPENTCIWLGHPGKESAANGFHEGITAYDYEASAIVSYYSSSSIRSLMHAEQSEDEKRNATAEPQR